MQNYKDLVIKILNEGIDKTSDVRTRYEDGTVAGYRSIDGEMLKFKMADGFPLSTLSKKSYWLIITELLWFTRGCTDLKKLTDCSNEIWTKNGWDHHNKQFGEIKLKDFRQLLESRNFDMGPIYGKQWRNFGGVDQLKQCIEKLKTNPNDRRMLVSAWNPPEIPDMALPPCHIMFQFFSYPLKRSEKIKLLHEMGHNYNSDQDFIHLRVPQRRLSMTMYQRSVDVLLGLPFNIASYASLLHMVAKITNHVPDTLTTFLGDCHLYDRHIEQAEELVKRDPKPLPKLFLRERLSIDKFVPGDFNIVGYDPHPAIKSEMAI